MVDPVPPASGDRGRRPLPADLKPSLEHPTKVRPRSDSDGCHRRPGQTTVKRCVYGDLRGTVSVVLFGDSHAAMWVPALDAIAARRGWRLYSVTKSACAVAAVPRAAGGHSASDCDTWRTNALAFIADIHPDLVIAANVERQGSPGQPPSGAWNAGMLATLTALVGEADQVVVFGETPRFQDRVPGCLRRHLDDTRPCDSPRSFALSPVREADDRATAAAAGPTYVSLSDITCPGDPCPSVVGRYMVSYDDQHLTPAYVRSLIPQIEARLPLH